jgi:putative aminopeptidase FrvX
VDALELLRELTAIPGPPGQEGAVRDALVRHVDSLGHSHSTDAKGNLLVRIGSGKPKVVVTAHMDEIAMIVRRVEYDGRLAVGPLGGMFPWKLGEGPVQILATRGNLDGLLSLGSIHTDDSDSNVRRAESEGVTWEMARILTGLSRAEVLAAGVRPGTRVVVHQSRRNLFMLENLVGGYFLDDRADLVSWLLALMELKGSQVDAVFAATVSEEVGGEGALYLLHDLRPDICVALELGPKVDDAPIELNDQPTVWASDSYSTMSAADGDLLAELGAELKLKLQFQALSRGGSDASCAASHGLCARPITLGIPMENSHGFEVIHPDAMGNLASLTSSLVRRLASFSP